MKDHLSQIGEISSDISEADILVSIGGDGTLLNTGKIGVQYNKPVVGINAGNLGYLCAFKIEEAPHLSLKDFESLKESKRTLIEYDGQVAINDICVLKGSPAQSIELSVENIADWKGDGVIVSTATGSSSYNQSAGGPVLDPLAKEIVVTPVCPHFSKVGPKIVKDDQVVINVPDPSSAVITIDNRVITDVKEKVVINKSDKVLRLLTK